MPGLIQNTTPEGKLFYVQKEGNSNVLEIRSIIQINDNKKYLIQCKQNFSWVSADEFYNLEPGYNMIMIEK